MQVTVKFFANFREVTGKSQVTVQDVSTVKELLSRLVGEFGPRLSALLYESGELRDTANVMINGRSIHMMDGLETKLKDGDVVAIFPPISGG
jgi:molybdopterin synthase sulfur carrier subunit